MVLAWLSVICCLSNEEVNMKKEKELMKVAQEKKILRLSAITVAEGLKIVKRYHKMVEQNSFPLEWVGMLK